MRIAAVSDLHIGDRAHSDTFRHAEGDFLGWLDVLEAQHDTLVLLGDIYQTDHGPLPGPASARRALALARERTERLSLRFAEPQYRWISGNHDPITHEVLGAARSLTFGEPGCRALFVHGDAYDPVIGRAPRLSAAGTWFTGQARAVGLRTVAEVLEDRDVTVKGRLHKGPAGPYGRAAQALMAEQGVQVVVMGHTHIPVRLELPDGVLANTGTCSRGRFMGVSVDTGTGEVRLLSR